MTPAGSACLHHVWSQWYQNIKGQGLELLSERDTVIPAGSPLSEPCLDPVAQLAYLVSVTYR